MKKLTLIGLLFAALLPAASFADYQANMDLMRQFPGPNVGKHGNKVPHKGRTYVLVPRICKISHVLVYVTGDNLQINDLDILFGNGDTQDIPMRQKYKENSWTVWKDVAGKERCIEGFSMNAKADRDNNNARVHLYGWREGRQVYIGSAVVKDFDFGRP